ncbi:MAG: hypothetical protein MJY98_06720 [Fibrobacter sp.]|nr:hypothetical protein [Fibrobacter sp.]
MRFSLRFSLVLGLLLGIAACSNGDKTAGGTEDTNGIVAIQDKLVSGVSQKGPFVNGSSVTMQELDPESFGQTGKSFEGKIKNDQGEFAVQVKELVSPYALLKANGFYRNEVSGERSTSQVTLYTITDLTDRDLVNVNLLTHLEYERSVYLVMHDSLTLANAKSRAKSEVLKAFYIDSDDENSEDLNIFGSGDGNAALLSISIMMQSNLKEAAFSERLANFASDLEDDGVWEDSSEIVKIADWSSEQSLSDGLYKIRQNIESWNIGDVPGFEKHIKSFWWNVYGLGLCSEARKSEVLRNQNEKSSFANVYFICKDNKWLIASDLEKDTYKWNNGADGESKSGTVIAENCYVYEVNAWRSGNVSDCTLGLNGCTTSHQNVVGQGSDKVWYTCDEKTWRSSTTYEKDTYGWKSATDGTIRKGNVTDTVYVFDKTVWRMTSTVESKLGGCVPAIKDSVGEVNGKYYICKGTAWAEATAIEYDTYKWSAGEDGESKTGSVNAKNCYVYENTTWRSGNVSDCTLGLNGCTTSHQNVVGQGSDKVWYTCDEKTWRSSTTYEKDTYGWKSATDGTIRKGNVTDTVYVFDKTVWRMTSTVESKLGGCVPAIKDSVGEVNGKYYICKGTAWAEATAIEYDTYKWSAGEDGESKTGSVNAKNCYVYENTTWRSGNVSDCTLNLRGCTKLRQDTVGLGSDKQWRICDSGEWRLASNIEMDTATWGYGTFNREVRPGQINKNLFYVFDKENGVWKNATTIEKDTYDYNNNSIWASGVDGELKKGAITDSIYVYDSDRWRTSTFVESKLGGCVGAIKDSVGKAGSIYYICVSRKWIEATSLQYDTYRWNDSIDGAWRKGRVNSSNIYVFDEKDHWRTATTMFDTLSINGCTTKRQMEHADDYDEDNERSHYYTCYNNKWYDGNEWSWDLPKEAYLNPDIEYDSITDERDGKIYKTVKIGDQVWMAENLNYADSVQTPSLKGKSWCYENSTCEKVAGRYYLWSAAIDSLSIYEKLSMKCGYGKECSLTGSIQGLCPKGWRLPSKDDWNALLLIFGKENMNMQLKTSIGWIWDSYSYHDGNGKNLSGFSAIPSGVRNKNGSVAGMGSYTGFWSSDDANNTNAWGLYIQYSNEYIWGVHDFDKKSGHPIRCIQDQYK